MSPAAALEVLKVEIGNAPMENAYWVQVEGLLSAPPAAVRHVLLHNCELRERFAYMKECVLFRTTERSAWSYSMVTPPVVDPRDYVLKRTVVEDLKADGTGTLRMAFMEDLVAGPAPRSGVVRVKVNRGSYEVSPRDGGTKAHINYQLTLAPGGLIPVWMARLAARRAAPESLSKIERVAAELWQAGKVVMPTEQAPWEGIPVMPLPGPRMVAPAP